MTSSVLFCSNWTLEIDSYIQRITQMQMQIQTQGMNKFSISCVCTCIFTCELGKNATASSLNLRISVSRLTQALVLCATYTDVTQKPDCIVRQFFSETLLAVTKFGRRIFILAWPAFSKWHESCRLEKLTEGLYGAVAHLRELSRHLDGLPVLSVNKTKWRPSGALTTFEKFNYDRYNEMIKTYFRPNSN